MKDVGDKKGKKRNIDGDEDDTEEATGVRKRLKGGKNHNKNNNKGGKFKKRK